MTPAEIRAKHATAHIVERITEQKHAKQRLTEALKTTLRRWGPGFNHLGDELRQAVMRAEMLAEIHRIPRNMVTADDYRSYVEALTEAAMQWQDATGKN